MKTLFLKLKHWQLFMLFFALPVLIYIITIVGFFIKMMSIKHLNNFDPSLFSGLLVGIFFMILISHGTLTLWNWSIGTQLIEKVPNEIRLKNRFFKFAVIFPFVYFLLMPFFMFQMMETIDVQSQQAPNFNPFILLLIIPLNFFALFCSFYTFYFNSKTYKSAQLQKEVTFGDYVGEFFLIMFFIVGVWIIQPKVNQMVETKSDF